MPRRGTPAKTAAAEGPVVEGFPIGFDPSKGRIYVQGIPAWFMSPQYYADMQAQLESLMGKAAKGIFYRAAEQAGTRTAKAFGAELAAAGDDPQRLAVLLRLAEFMRTVGHGATELVIGDIGRLETTWTMPHSYIAELHASSKEPVCHYYSGYFAGVVSATFGRSVVCEEVECRAKGDDRCAFRTWTP